MRPQFDLSDNENMSAEENKSKEKAMRAEAKAALENAKSKTPGIPKGQEEMYQLLDEIQEDAKTPEEQREMRALLDEVQKEQDKFTLAPESEQVHQIKDEDIEVISEEEANIADALKDVRQVIKTMPPPLPPSQRFPAPRELKQAGVTPIEDARRKREEKKQKDAPKKSGLGKFFSGIFGRRKAANE